ncbi:MAG: hypothetical protein KDB37_17455 [Ilumatobacter sp.]|nr:hypothetical protein [Ilumatobacter sp.]
MTYLFQHGEFELIVGKNVEYDVTGWSVYCETCRHHIPNPDEVRHHD